MAYGLVPLTSSGAEVTRWYEINSSYTTAIYLGSAVILSSGYVQNATAGATILGVFRGCRFVDSGGELHMQKSWSGESSASNIWAEIAVPTEGDFFKIQGDGQSALSESNVGQHFDLNVGTSGDTTTKISGHVLDTTSAGSDGTLVLHGLFDPERNSWGSEAHLVVSVNERVTA